jgi:murein L,D-transpeptidase YcbB/YkuD
MRMTHGWKHEQLDPIFAQTSTQTFTLAEPIPLHVTYWTAWADPEGTINFRDDIYKQDRYALSTRR